MHHNIKADGTCNDFFHNMVVFFPSNENLLNARKLKCRTKTEETKYIKQLNIQQWFTLKVYLQNKLHFGFCLLVFCLITILEKFLLKNFLLKLFREMSFRFCRWYFYKSSICKPSTMFIYFYFFCNNAICNVYTL